MLAIDRLYAPLAGTAIRSPGAMSAANLTFDDEASTTLPHERPVATPTLHSHMPSATLEAKPVTGRWPPMFGSSCKAPVRLITATSV